MSFVLFVLVITGRRLEWLINHLEAYVLKLAKREDPVEDLLADFFAS